MLARLSCFIFIFIYTHSAYSSSNNVVDLGNLEVEGEIRKPSVTWVDSENKAVAQLPNIYDREFQLIEAQVISDLDSLNILPVNRSQPFRGIKGKHGLEK